MYQFVIIMTLQSDTILTIPAITPTASGEAE